MSIAALLRGTESHLRSASQFDDQPSDAVGKYFGVQPAPGKPPRNFGQWYVALSWNGGKGNDANPQRHDVFHGIVATLTARLNYAPKDRQGIRLTTAAELYDLIDRVAGPNVIHGSWALINEANALIPGTAEYVAAAGTGTATVNGFCEPLILDSYGPERLVTGDWIGAAETKDTYAIDIKFRLARRIRAYTG